MSECCDDDSSLGPAIEAVQVATAPFFRLCRLDSLLIFRSRPPPPPPPSNRLFEGFSERDPLFRPPQLRRSFIVPLSAASVKRPSESLKADDPSFPRPSLSAAPEAPAAGPRLIGAERGAICEPDALSASVRVPGSRSSSRTAE